MSWMQPSRSTVTAALVAALAGAGVAVAQGGNAPVRTAKAAAAKRGPRGPVGPAGPAGPQGARGPQGGDGPQGPAGAAGAQGAAGSQGAAGNQGNDGARGPTGPMGPTGPSGVDGNRGPTGPAGSTGPTGPAGPVAPIVRKSAAVSTPNQGPINKQAFVTCNAGERAMGGGPAVEDTNAARLGEFGTDIIQSRPLKNYSTAAADAGDTPTGWMVEATNNSGAGGSTVNLFAYVICVP